MFFGIEDIYGVYIYIYFFKNVYLYIVDSVHGPFSVYPLVMTNTYGT